MMYDRQTKTMWQQFLGEPIVGPLVDSGLTLEVLPVVVTTWGEWLAAHPDTTVLDSDTGVYPKWAYVPEEDSGSAYYGYRLNPQAMFPVWQRSELLPEKAEVLGLLVHGHPKAYLLEALHEAALLNDVLGRPKPGGGLKRPGGRSRLRTKRVHPSACSRSLQTVRRFWWTSRHGPGG